MSIAAELELRTKIAPGPTGTMVDEDTLTVELNDGRTISVPWVWFLRLLYGIATFPKANVV